MMSEANLSKDLIMTDVTATAGNAVPEQRA